MPTSHQSTLSDNKKSANKKSDDKNHIDFNNASDKTILACIDGSNVTRSVCDYAAWYASALGDDASVSLLHVIDVPKSNRHDLSGAIGVDSRRNLLEDLTLLDEKTARAANKHGEALVKDAKTHILAKSSDITVHLHLRRSKLLPAIQHYLKHSRIVILGRRGEDHQDDHINIGSQIENVVRSVKRPILVCSEDFETPDSFLIAFDASPTAQRAIDIVCENEVAKKLQGHLVMVNHKDSGCEKQLYKAKQQMRKAGFDITAHLIDSKSPGNDNDVVTSLINFQNKHNISMFIIGAYGHSKLRRFFVGSTTTKLLTKATSPVILLR